MTQGQVNFQQTDVFVDGSFTCTNFICPDGSITDADIQAAAGLSASKLQHQREPVYVQEAGTTLVTEKRTIGIIYGATALLVAMKAYIALAGAGGGMSVTIRLKRTRATVTTTVTSADITINSGTVAYTLINAAGFTDTALLQNDILEVDVTATSGGGTLPKGLGVQLIYKEDAQ